MKGALVSIAVLVLAVAAFFGAVLLASESGEVVTLRSHDAAGELHATRLWVVDHDGAEWVRTGHAGKGWFVRIEATPEVELERGGATSARVARPTRDPATVRAVNEAFARKYGAADWIVALSGDASKRIPVRLDAVSR